MSPAINQGPHEQGRSTEPAALAEAPAPEPTKGAPHSGRPLGWHVCALTQLFTAGDSCQLCRSWGQGATDMALLWGQRCQEEEGGKTGHL